MSNVKVINVKDIGLHLQEDSYFSFEPTNSGKFNPHVIFKEFNGFLQYLDKTKFLKESDYTNLKTATNEQVKDIVKFFDEFDFDSDLKQYHELLKRLEFQSKSLMSSYESFVRYYSKEPIIVRLRYQSNAKFLVESHPNLEINNIVYSLELVDETRDKLSKIKLCPI
jgi:hypothetical protein